MEEHGVFDGPKEEEPEEEEWDDAQVDWPRIYWADDSPGKELDLLEEWDYIYKEDLSRGMLVQLRVPQEKGRNTNTLNLPTGHCIGANARAGKLGRWENLFPQSVNAGARRGNESFSLENARNKD